MGQAFKAGAGAGLLIHTGFLAGSTAIPSGVNNGLIIPVGFTPKVVFMEYYGTPYMVQEGQKIKCVNGNVNTSSVGFYAEILDGGIRLTSGDGNSTYADFYFTAIG